jgi:hypothetical protein
MPTLEDPAHDQRQLCTEVDRLFEGETVPKLVQDGPRDAVGLVLVGEIAVVAQLLEPFLRLLYGVSDGWPEGSWLVLLCTLARRAH